MIQKYRIYRWFEKVRWSFKQKQKFYISTLHKSKINHKELQQNDTQLAKLKLIFFCHCRNQKVNHYNATSNKKNIQQHASLKMHCMQHFEIFFARRLVYYASIYDICECNKAIFVN